MFPTVSPWGTMVYVKLNKQYIVNVLCVNRTHPERHCDGQCYLAKLLKKQKEQEKKELAERARTMPVFQLFSQPNQCFEFVFKTFVMKETADFFYRLTFYASITSRLLKPPRK